MTTEFDRDLAASAALGAISAEELSMLESKMSKDAALADELDEYRSTVAALESGVARQRPPLDLFDRVLARIETDELAREEDVLIDDRRAGESSAWRRWRPYVGTRWSLPAFTAGVAAAAATIAVAFAVSSGDEPGSPAAQAAVRGTPAFSQVHGEARIYRADRSNGVLVLDLAEVPTALPGEHYEVWVLREGSDSEMEAVGVFSPENPDLQLEFRLPGTGDYQAVDVSVEPDAGSPAHSGRSLAGGRFELRS